MWGGNQCVMLFTISVATHQLWTMFQCNLEKSCEIGLCVRMKNNVSKLKAC